MGRLRAATLACCLLLACNPSGASRHSARATPSSSEQSAAPSATTVRARATSSATEDARSAPPSSIEERVERATVKIELFKGKRSMSFGTGFFISDDGLLLTNYHVFSDVLVRKHEPVFYLDRRNKRTLRDFEVLRCMDHRDVDLCLLKLPHEPQSFLPIGEHKPKVGDAIVTVGNPKGHDFTLERGKISRIHRDIRKAIKINDYTRNRRVELLQLSADLRKGFSGGPVVDLEGRLLGINSVIMHPPKKGDPKLVLAISAKELRRYVAKKSRFNLKRFVAKQIDDNPILTTPADELSERQIKKACKTLQKDECIAGIKAACADRKRKAECKRLRDYFGTLVGKPSASSGR
jgi:S1-C subfamily serine protease